jgi:hypothetical protein
MMILHIRAPPEKIFPGRVAQLVDHPYKCRTAANRPCSLMASGTRGPNEPEKRPSPGVSRRSEAESGRYVRGQRTTKGDPSLSFQDTPQYADS